LGSAGPYAHTALLSNGMIGSVSSARWNSRRRAAASTWTGNCHQRNLQAGQVVRFVCDRAARYGRILLVLDRWNPHRTAVRQLQALLHRRLQLEWLPPYAPDLNPAEQLWNHTKYADLANFVADDLHHLGRRVGLSLYYQSRRSTLLRSFFKTAKLRL
jgi:transposase